MLTLKKLRFIFCYKCVDARQICFFWAVGLGLRIQNSFYIFV